MSIHQFAEKVALVTDGASEIGRAVALQLALQGCYVIVGFSNANAETAKSALFELQNLGTLANAVETDVSTVEGARQLVGEVEKLFGRLDLLVNSLKYKTDSTFEKTDESAWTQTIDSNLKATFFVTQAAVALMKARPKPVIVNVVSDCETTGENLAFAVTQESIKSLTKSLAKQLAPKFRVNAVTVGEAKKEITEILDAELFRPKSGRIAADDVARAVLFLLSSEAVGLNGQILTVS